MAWRYSTKDFFRQIPHALLARYLDRQGLFGDLDFVGYQGDSAGGVVSGNVRAQSYHSPMNSHFAAKGSRRWLQIAVDRAPELLDEALRRAGAIDADDSVLWKSPLASDQFTEYKDAKVLWHLGVNNLRRRSLEEFWPRRGPVWDALGRSRRERLILVEAKAHIPEAASQECKASEASLKRIRRSLEKARRFYAPRSKADWSACLYQYANRLAFQYFFAHVNGLPTRLVFLDFYNAVDVDGPKSEAEWRGATRLIHALLGLPADLTKHGVFHAYVDVRLVKNAL